MFFGHLDHRPALENDDSLKESSVLEEVGIGRVPNPRRVRNSPTFDSSIHHSCLIFQWLGEWAGIAFIVPFPRFRQTLFETQQAEHCIGLLE